MELPIGLPLPTAAPIRDPYAQYITAAGQTVTSGSNDIVNFGTKVADTHDQVTVGASWTWTCKYPGLYAVDFLLLWEAVLWASGGPNTNAQVWKNGALYRNMDNRDGGDVTEYIRLQGSIKIPFLLGDTMYIKVFHDRGGNTSLHNDGDWNWITVARIGTSIRF